MKFDDVLRRYDYSFPEEWEKLTPMRLKANMLKYVRENAPSYLYKEFSKMLTSLSDTKFKREVKRMNLINSNYND